MEVEKLPAILEAKDSETDYEEERIICPEETEQLEDIEEQAEEIIKIIEEIEVIEDEDEEKEEDDDEKNKSHINEHQSQLSDAQGEESQDERKYQEVLTYDAEEEEEETDPLETRKTNKKKRPTMNGTKAVSNGTADEEDEYERPTKIPRLDEDSNPQEIVKRSDNDLIYTVLGSKKQTAEEKIANARYIKMERLAEDTIPVAGTIYCEGDDMGTLCVAHTLNEGVQYHLEGEEGMQQEDQQMKQQEQWDDSNQIIMAEQAEEKNNGQDQIFLHEDEDSQMRNKKMHDESQELDQMTRQALSPASSQAEDNENSTVTSSNKQFQLLHVRGEDKRVRNSVHFADLTVKVQNLAQSIKLEVKNFKESVQQRHEELMDSIQQFIPLKIILRNMICNSDCWEDCADECHRRMANLNLESSSILQLVQTLLDCARDPSRTSFCTNVAKNLCEFECCYSDAFEKEFILFLEKIHSYSDSTDFIKTTASVFAELISTYRISHRILKQIPLIEENFSSMSLKLFASEMFQELRIRMSPSCLDFIVEDSGVLPEGHSENTTFVIQFFTSIGLSGVVNKLRMCDKKKKSKCSE